MTNTPLTQPASGVDLARVALQAARAAAKSSPAPKRRTGAGRPKRSRTGGRDPLPFAAALERMMTERGWNMAAKGGSIIDQWPTIAPELAGKVQAVRFDDDTRTLDLKPISPAYRTQLELYQRQIIDKVNTAVGDGTVRQLRILTPGAVQQATAQPAQAEQQQATPVPAEPRAKNPHYLEALAAHNAHKPTRDGDMDRRVRAALEDQNHRLRQHREPEEAFTESAAQEEILRQEADRGRPASAAEATRWAAIAYKRTGRTVGGEPRRLFEAS